MTIPEFIKQDGSSCDACGEVTDLVRIDMPFTYADDTALSCYLCEACLKLALTTFEEQQP